MERDERLLPLPNIGKIQTTDRGGDYPASYAPPYTEGAVDKRSVQEYLNVVYKRLPLILALTILTTSATAFYMYRQQNRYSSRATIVIEPPKPKATDTINISFGNDRKYYNTQLKLLQNPELMYAVVVANGLYKNPNLMGRRNRGVLRTIKSMFSRGVTTTQDDNTVKVESDSETSDGVSTKSKLKGQDEARAKSYAMALLGGIQVTDDLKTNIVNISVTNHDPVLTSTLANGIAEQFIEQDRQRATQQESDFLKDIGKSIDKLKEGIAEDERNLISALKSANLPLTGDNQANLTSSRLSALSAQWISAIKERQDVEIGFETAKKDINYLMSDMINNSAISEAERNTEQEKAKLREELRAIDTRINASEAELSDLQVRYTDKHKDVQRLKAKIAKLKSSRSETESAGTKRIENEGGRISKTAKSKVLNGLQAKLRAMINRESRAKQAYKAEEAKAASQGQAASGLRTLRGEIDSKRQTLNNLTTRQNNMELSINSSRPDNIKIMSGANPGGFAGPDRNRNIVLAFIVSLIGGIGLSFLLDFLDDSIRTTDDVSRSLGLPTLALIPFQDSVSAKQLAGESADGNAGGAEISAPPSLALIALHDKRSIVAEAFRHLRTSLLFSSAGNPPRTILVTSTQPSEGKTTTSINTAIALAQSDANVVVVDCDLRRPRLHSHFSMSNTRGLTNYLSGEKDMENLVKPLPELPNLKVITSGPIPPNPAELLSSKEMRNLIELLKTNFDHVIIDSPPAISFTDSAILSTLVDGVVLVAKANSSSIHLLRRFKQRLASLGTRIYGVVLNGVKPDSIEYGYYGYDYSYDYYTNSDASTPLLEDALANESVEGDPKLVENENVSTDAVTDETDFSEFIDDDNILDTDE